MAMISSSQPEKVYQWDALPQLGDDILFYDCQMPFTCVMNEPVLQRLMVECIQASLITALWRLHTIKWSNETNSVLTWTGMNYFLWQSGWVTYGKSCTQIPRFSVVSTSCYPLTWTNGTPTDCIYWLISPNENILRPKSRVLWAWAQMGIGPDGGGWLFGFISIPFTISMGLLREVVLRSCCSFSFS